MKCEELHLLRYNVAEYKGKVKSGKRAFRAAVHLVFCLHNSPPSLKTESEMLLDKAMHVKKMLLLLVCQ